MPLTHVSQALLDGMTAALDSWADSGGDADPLYWVLRVKAAEARGHHVVTVVDPTDGEGIDTLTDSGAKVAIDFSVPGAVRTNAEAVAGAGLDLVIGTTGWHEDLDPVTRIVEAGGTGMLHAPNFALGVHLFRRVIEEAIRLAERVGSFAVQVRESHHRHKLDSPSGTAIHLAEAIIARSETRTRWEVGPPPADPNPRILYISSRREGEITGTHTVVLQGDLERMEFTHEALDRAVFADGAVRAAEWLRGRTGVFTIDDLFSGGN